MDVAVPGHTQALRMRSLVQIGRKGASINLSTHGGRYLIKKEKLKSIYKRERRRWKEGKFNKFKL
jgi:hypothetical protein